LERFLEPEDRRQQFYEALTAFARTLQVTLGTVYFYQETPESQVNRYKSDFRFFHNLRISVRQRYAETIDYKDYEQKVRSLMNQHITSSEVRPITELVNIFDNEAFASEVEKIEGNAAKADTIAYRVKKTITARIAENPQMYRRFSQLISETIEAYRAGRLSEAEYLNRMRDILEQVQQGTARNIPARLHRYQHASAYFGVLQSVLETSSVGLSAIPEDVLADMAIEIEKIIEKRKIRDWVANRDIQKAMMNDIEDYLYAIKVQYDLPLTGVEMDLILEQLLEVAKQRNRL